MAEEPKVRIRFRRTMDVKGIPHAAGSYVALPKDEAWALIDTGAADADPPPGVGGQPMLPPEESGGEKTGKTAEGKSPPASSPERPEETPAPRSAPAPEEKHASKPPPKK